ncbi:MAG: hypothetical protein RLZZ524_1882 [Pseudomonadota bacterium]
MNSPLTTNHLATSDDLAPAVASRLGGDPAAPGRRRFMRLAGGGVVVAAAGSSAVLTGCASGYPDAAVAAWQRPVDDQGDVRRFALAHALLAPNPHNRQPWIADLRRPGEISLSCDLQRLLPETDPFGRQILIGHGAFLELLVIAAAERGYRAEVQPFPDGEPSPQALDARPVAHIVLRADATWVRDPLFAQIHRRHTHKGRYDATRALAPGQAQALRAVLSAASADLTGGLVLDAPTRQTVSTLARQAYEAEMATPRTYLESARLFRIGPDEITRHRDGIAINGLMPRVLSALGLFKREQVPVPGDAVWGQVMDRWADFDTGSGYVWIASRDTGRRAQLAAGRAYVRLHLAATALGVDMQPLSQALQEFAEVSAPYAAIHRLLGLDPQRTPLQMLARVGYGVGAAPATPRRGLAALLAPGSAPSA